MNTSLEPEYTPTTNSLKDVITWISLGNYVELHHFNTRNIIYFNKDKIRPDAYYFKINLIDSLSASLLNEGEWCDYILRDGNEIFTGKPEFKEVIKLNLNNNRLI